MIYPPVWVLIGVPPVTYAALIFIFAVNKTESGPAYLIYFMSAYSLVILTAQLPYMAGRIRRLKLFILNKSRLVGKIMSVPSGKRYLLDPEFRGSISIYQGMAVNFLYMLFRIAAGIRYTSVWFISMAVYYMMLGLLRAYLIRSYCRRESEGLEYEYRCYRNTAWLLFLLNIPMGGMIVLMVNANSGFFYPGYIIYISALYTFYTMIMSAVNLVKFRKIGSPILSASKVLNFVSAMMSILGLQTAMISRFSSDGEGYRKMMNAVTGGCVYGAVIVIAVYMLIHTAVIKKKVMESE